jgi:hypothetical protein
MPSTRPGWPAVLAIALLALPTQASAALVRWHFTGRVVQITGDVGGSNPAKIASLGALGVVPNAPVSGSFAFESTTPDSQPADTAVGEYLGAISDLVLRAGNYTTRNGAIGPMSNAIVVATPAAVPLSPAIYTNSTGSDSPQVAANDVLFVLDLAGGALPIVTDALPTTPPNPALAEQVTFVLVSDNEYVIAFELDSLSATAPTPVTTLPPASAALLVLALGAALGLARQTGRMPRFFGGRGSSGRAR